MDIMLERILSLIPKDDDGKYVHGAKAEFAKSIGYNDGAIVSMWIKGTSTSYKNKLHEIAEKYGVSVNWLRGETDDPGIKEAPATEGEGLSAAKKALLVAIDDLSDAQCEKLLPIVLSAKQVL